MVVQATTTKARKHEGARRRSTRTINGERAEIAESENERLSLLRAASTKPGAEIDSARA
jgi:hypothetical protein